MVVRSTSRPGQKVSTLGHFDLLSLGQKSRRGRRSEVGVQVRRIFRNPHSEFPSGSVLWMSKNARSGAPCAMSQTARPIAKKKLSRCGLFDGCAPIEPPTLPTPATSRDQKPRRSGPMLAQGKSAHGGRRPGFRGRCVSSAEPVAWCIELVLPRPKQGELDFGLGNALAVRRAPRSADEHNGNRSQGGGQIRCRSLSLALG